MQGAQGSSGSAGGGGGSGGAAGSGARPGYGGRGMAAVAYGSASGYLYNHWGAYNGCNMQPMQPMIRPAFSRGASARPFVPLGVQGAGILKRPVGPPQGPLVHGSGHARGYCGRTWGGRGRKQLTKEALDADLDEWRMKDKTFGGQSLDADLDEYWKKKDDESELLKRDGETKSPEHNTGEGSKSPSKEPMKEVKASTSGGRAVHQNNGDGDHVEDSSTEPSRKGG